MFIHTKRKPHFHPLLTASFEKKLKSDRYVQCLSWDRGVVCRGGKGLSMIDIT